MPIRINLLAEAQAAEELRRKDPVKRAIVGGAILVSAILVWGGTLQCKIIASKHGLKSLQSQWGSIEKSYQAAVEHQRQSMEVGGRLTALQQFKTNRFLWGTALNAFQQSLSGLDDVQVIRLKTEQGYVLTDEVKGKDGRGGKPATSTEKISMIIDAIDSSAQPGSQVSHFKEALANVPYFQSHLQKTNGVLLTSLSAPQSGPMAHNPYVMLTLQCYFPEKVR
jgi:hypothetical protein